MFTIQLQTIHHGYDRRTCWVHARPGAIPPVPGGDGTVVVTMQKLRITGDDVFYELNDMRTDDRGATWSGPCPHETLGRRKAGGGLEEGVSDFSLAWHAASGKLLGTGHTVLYQNDDLPPLPRSRRTVYSHYDLENRTWAPWKKLELPDRRFFFSEGAGSTQRVDLPNGEILLPTYIGLSETVRDEFYIQLVSTVMRCRFDGETLCYLGHGTELTLPEGRGFGEPSLARSGGRFFLTLRNNDAAYVTSGDDGLTFGTPRRWTFDDGSELGSYNTQQHWMTHRDDLYLVYTRKGAGNDHILRHRAPLFMGKVDKERLCVLRETEKIVVPERGAALGNFGVTQVDDDEVWIVVSEWMQTTLPDPFDCAKCEKRGSDNSVFVAKVRFA